MRLPLHLRGKHLLQVHRRGPTARPASVLHGQNVPEKGEKFERRNSTRRRRQDDKVSDGPQGPPPGGHQGDWKNAGAEAQRARLQVHHVENVCSVTVFNG